MCQFHELSQISGYVINLLCQQDENEKEKWYILPLKKKNATNPKEKQLPKDESFLFIGLMCPSHFG